MSSTRALLAIDQGTTSSRAIIFDENGVALAGAQQEFPQNYPADGWVEHDPDEIWDSVLKVCRQALAELGTAGPQVEAIGITNQRETTLLWDRKTGEPLYNAIVWQDRRTAEHCARLKELGHEAAVTAATGLLIDPYFSATKLAWLLDHIDGARARAEAGELAFGTVDSYLLWRLTGGRVHATDATNASRTLLFNIHSQQWDQDMLDLFGIPKAVLPEVKDCAADFGLTEAALLGRALPVCGMAGDQQAALIGQACFEPGMIKSTYGTGCFMVLNTGEQAVRSANRLLTTVAYRLAGRTTYAVEGSIFIAGAAVQWVRDGLKLIRSAAETEGLARSLDSNHGVYLVPAFTGLGAPYWDPHARGALFGLTRNTGIAEIVRAALEAVCYQSADLMSAMVADGASLPKALRVDGGMAANDWLMQFLADLLGISVERPAHTETTALGAACLAGLQRGIYTSLEDVSGHWRCEARFTPTLPEAQRARLIQTWKQAVARVRSTQTQI